MKQDKLLQVIKRRKWLALLIGVSLLSLLGIVFMYSFTGNCQNHQTSSPGFLSIPPRGEIGIDYYHESMGNILLSNAEIDRDLDLISQVTYKLKVYHNPLASASPQTDNKAPLEIVKNIVRRAKAHHMYVVWTENDDSVKLTDASWQTYANAVMADAAQAASVGADEFLVGNEISIHNNGDPGFSDEKLPQRIKQLVTDCATRFSGPKGYEDGWFKSESWHRAGLGPLQKIYFTLYEPWHAFKSAADQIAADFGQKAELGEVSTMTTKQALHDDEQAWTRDLLRRYDYGRQKALPIWLFAFREPDNDSFGLFQANPRWQAHTIWDYLTRQKTLSYTQLLSNNFQGNTTQAFIGDGYNYHHRLRADAFNQPVIASIPAENYVFRGTVRPGSATGPEKWRAMRLVFRYKDANNYYFLNIEVNDGRVQLFKRQDGVETALADVPTSIRPGVDYDFEIRASGSGQKTSLQVFWNTVQLLVIPDPTASILTSGGVGMKNNGATGELSDVVVTTLER